MTAPKESGHSALDIRLDQMAELETNWDSYGAHAPSSLAIEAARRVIRSMGVMPTINGGVSVYMAAEALTFELDAQGVLVAVVADAREVADYLRGPLP